MNEDFIRRYASDVCNILRKIHPGPVLEAVSALYAAWQRGKVVMFCGNGGSGASCSHIVNDLQKNIGLEVGKPLKAICLADGAPLVSAWANDSAWSNVFAPQVATWSECGAVLVAVSGSGNSANILNAVQVAVEYECVKTIGLTGFDGGLLAKVCDISIHVPTESMQQAEDAHMVILHMLYLGLLERIKAGAK
jgi:D-sedoheptulose 7-phosphate isomerase